MNKKMRELLAKIKEKNLQARNFQNEGKTAEAKPVSYTHLTLPTTLTV